jgi:hypothetical protein
VPGEIHPLQRELRRTDLKAPTSARMDAIFTAAKQGGVTPAERQLLHQVLASKDDWSDASRRAWQSRLSGLKVGAQVVRPSQLGSAQAEDLSGDVRVMWTQGYDSDVQRVYVTDLLRLARRYDFKMILQVPPRRRVADLLADLRARTGLSAAQLNQLLSIVKADWGFSDWSEDGKVLTNGDDVTRAVEVLIPPEVSEQALSRAYGYVQDEGYHPLDPESFQGAVVERQEHITAQKLARRLGRKQRQARCYVEGGNLLPATSSDGKAYALVGQDSLIISAFHLDE